MGNLLLTFSGHVVASK